MGFADAILVCYALGSVCAVLGLFPVWRRLRGPAAWLIAAGFVLHSVSIFRLFIFNDVEELGRGAFLQILAWSLVFVYCVVWWRLRFAFLGITAGPLALALFFFAAGAGDTPVSLPEAMPAAFVVLHLVALFLNFALLTLGLGSALFFLNLHRKLKSKKLLQETDGKMPSLATVDRINGLIVMIGFPLFSVGLLAGFAWAHLMRGVPVTSDPKEIASVLLWLLYAFVFMQRVVLGRRGKKTAVMLVVLFLAALVSFAGVNLFMDSHHSFFQVRGF